MHTYASLFAAAGLLALSAGPAPACALALVFALDVSASVDAEEYALQRDGLANALLDPAVRAAVVAQPGGVAFYAYEWSGRYQQDQMLGWTRVSTEDELVAMAGALSGAKRSYAEFPTAVGYALGHGAVVMRGAPPACQRRVIDISGDGIGNEGFGPRPAYREFEEFAEITVNGLVVGGGDLELISYYDREVRHGAGSFIEVAESFLDYQAAMKRKLLRELYGAQLAEAP